MNEPPADRASMPPPESKGRRPGLRFNFSKFETPFVIKHVESHLIFGPLARHFSAAWLAVGLFAVFWIALLLSAKSGAGLPSAPGIVFGLSVLWMLTRTTLRQQATFIWAIAKGVLFFVCFLSLTMALPLWLRDNRTDLRSVVFLSLIWFPLFEFIPRVTPYQRYLTFARFILSIPFVIDILTNPQNTWS